MRRRELESILEAINRGDTSRAVEMASAALKRADGKEPEAHVSADYEILELKIGDAKRLVEEAVAFYRNCGKEIALSEFSNPKGRFTNGQQYVYAINPSGIMLAHPINENYIGKDFLHVVDFGGRHFIKEIVNIANAKGSGWIEYQWLNPANSSDQAKTVYFEKCNDTIICSGIYTSNNRH